MNSGIDRLRRATAAVAMAGLLGLASGCGGAGDTSTGGTATAAGTKAAGTKAASAPKGEAAGSDKDMEDGCDAVHELLAKLDAGDKSSAESLKGKGKAKFDGVASAEATNDKQQASNASAMSEMLAFDLPEKPVYKSELAEIYTVDCVAQYGSPALPA